MSTDFFQIVRELAEATRKARERVADSSISTRTRDGLIQIVRITYTVSGKSVVSEVSGWLPIDGAIQFLDTMH